MINHMRLWLQSCDPDHRLRDPFPSQISVDNTALRLTLQIQHQLARASISAAPTLESTIVTEITYGSQSMVRLLSEYYAPPERSRICS
jgi:hypothetical protein